MIRGLNVSLLKDQKDHPFGFFRQKLVRLNHHRPFILDWRISCFTPALCLKMKYKEKVDKLSIYPPSNQVRLKYPTNRLPHSPSRRLRLAACAAAALSRS